MEISIARVYVGRGFLLFLRPEAGHPGPSAVRWRQAFCVVACSDGKPENALSLQEKRRKLT
jgi:hypothetical protein